MTLLDEHDANAFHPITRDQLRKRAQDFIDILRPEYIEYHYGAAILREMEEVDRMRKILRGGECCTHLYPGGGLPCVNCGA